MTFCAMAIHGVGGDWSILIYINSCICWLPNQEIYITGTAPCSTGTGYSTSTVSLPSWYCPTFFCRSVVFHFSVSLRYLLDVPCIADTMLLLFRWSTRFGDGFSMLLIVLLSLLVLQWTIALSPPPLLMHPMRGIPLVPYALAILLLRVLTEFSWHIKTLPVW